MTREIDVCSKFLSSLNMLSGKLLDRLVNFFHPKDALSPVFVHLGSVLWGGT